MKQALRMSSATVALAIGLASPALAQDETVAADSPSTTLSPPPSEDAVGPAQLRDFSINGTVTRRAETPAATAPQPSAQPTVASNAQNAQRSAPASTVADESRPERPASAQAQRSAQGPLGDPSASAFNFTPSAPAANQPASFAPGSIVPQATTPVDDTFAESEAGLFSRWPWLLALLAAVGAALWYFRRQRSGFALAGAGADASAFEFSPPARPQPARPAPPRPASAPQRDQRAPAAGGVITKPAPAPAPAQGIVSTRLRPWLDIDFQPQAAIIDAEKGSIQFEVVVYNSGSAPARDVLVEAALFNAGSDQDQLLGNFFGRATLRGTDGATIPPLQRMSFRSIVTLPRDQLRLFEVEGRTLFVPVVGFNAVYRWSSGDGQTSASFIVGRNANGEKMAPFRVEQGPKTYRGLAAREHTLGVRK